MFSFNNISSLPIELIDYSFRFLSPEEKLNASLVCKLFYQIIFSEKASWSKSLPLYFQEKRQWPQEMPESLKLIFPFPENIPTILLEENLQKFSSTGNYVEWEKALYAFFDKKKSSLIKGHFATGEKFFACRIKICKQQETAQECIFILTQETKVVACKKSVLRSLPCNTQIKLCVLKCLYFEAKEAQEQMLNEEILKPLKNFWRVLPLDITQLLEVNSFSALSFMPESFSDWGTVHISWMKRLISGEICGHLYALHELTECDVILSYCLKN